jgi:hypothetical protein
VSNPKATVRAKRIRVKWAEAGYLACRAALAPTLRPTGRRNSRNKRWLDNNSLDESWDERSSLMARHIPAGSRVVDVGAGAQALRSVLPPDCTYVPVDIVQRTPDTITCDLNREEPPALSADYLVASGLVEYINDAGRLVRWMASVAPNIVLSYEAADGESRRYRRNSGWVNDYTQGEIRELLSRNGLKVADSATWRRQTIYWLVRSHACSC